MSAKASEAKKPSEKQAASKKPSVKAAGRKSTTTAAGAKTASAAKAGGKGRGKSAVNPQVAAWKEALRVGESLLGAMARNSGLPGFQVAVSVDGRHVGDIAWGLADVEHGTPMTPQTLMRVASHSKTFTATGIHQLVEQGRLRLDDRVETWIPELTGEALGAATVSELLSHSAGVARDGRDSDHWSLAKPFPDREGVIQMAREGSILPRNERLKYTNVGYTLLGFILEAASGMSFADVMKQGIIDPLKLKNTGPELNERFDEAATGYTGRGSDIHDPFRRVPIDHVDSRAMAPATGFYSTARDLCRYFSAHLLEGTEFERKRTGKLLTDDTKRLAQRPVNSLEGRGYGLGFMCEEIGGKTTFGHSGGYPGFISRTWGVQSTGVVLSVIATAIDGPAAEFGKALFALADLALAPAHASLKGVPTSRLRRFEGTFAGLWGQTEFACLGRNLYEFAHGYGVDSKTQPLEFVDSRTLRESDPYGFAAHGECTRFEFDDDGRAVRLRTGNGSTMVRLEDFSLPKDRVRMA